MARKSPILTYIAYTLATINLYFGINGLLRPRNALEVFQFPYPDSESNPDFAKLIDGLMALYGVRDIFMALSVFVALRTGARVVVGWLMIFVFGVAVVDGFVNRAVVGMGEWTHWGYAPVVACVGLGFLL